MPDVFIYAKEGIVYLQVERRLADISDVIAVSISEPLGKKHAQIKTRIISVQAGPTVADVHIEVRTSSKESASQRKLRQLSTLTALINTWQYLQNIQKFVGVKKVDATVEISTSDWAMLFEETQP